VPEAKFVVETTTHITNVLRNHANVHKSKMQILKYKVRLNTVITLKYVSFKVCIS